MLRRSLFILTALFLTVSALGQSHETSSLKAATFVPPRRWAMVIGASDYKEMGKLSYASADAKSFAKTLAERFHFEPETLELITDDPGSAKKPDAATIGAALDRQIADKRLEKGDLFIFYFAGHGLGTSRGDVLLPTDATHANAAEIGLPVKAILDRFVKAGLKNVLVIVDACREGEKNEFGAELEELGRKANIGVILGCAPGHRSYEYPQLGHGVFTHFLMRALKDKSLCSPISGALWTSRVGEQVQHEVQEYTVRDYPNAPQVPLAASEKSQDVLLGSFVSAIEGSKAVEAFRKEVDGLSADKRLAAFSTFASDLYGQEKYGDAAEVFKTIEGLDHLSPFTRYMFGTCLTFLGRHKEAERQFAELGKQDESPLMKALSITFAPSRKVTPEQRLKGALDAWAIEPAEWVGLLVWTCAQLYAPKTEVNKIIDMLLAVEDLEPRWRKFLSGYKALNAGDAKTALARLDEAAQTPGELPKDELLDSIRLLALNYAGRFDESLALLKKKIEDPETSAKWCLVLAQRYKEDGKSDLMLATVKTALGRSMDPDDLLFALRVVGIRYPEIAPELLKRADEFPLTWKAAVAKLCCSQNNADQALAQALKYNDDEFGPINEYLRIHDLQMDELVGRQRVSDEDYYMDQLFTSAVMANNVDEFGYDPFSWSLYLKTALYVGKCEQAKALFERYLGKQLDAGTLDPMLRPLFFTAAINVGDNRRVEQLWKLQGLSQTDTMDMALAYSAYLAIQGKIDQARACFPSYPPSPVFRSTADALRFYLDGTKVSVAGGSPTVGQLVTLAYAKQGDWKKAEPLLKAAANVRIPSFTFLQAKTAQVYFDRLIATGRVAEANEFVYDILTSAYGNPLYKQLRYSPGSFAGIVGFSIVAMDVPPEYVKGEMKLEIGQSGVVKLTGKLGINAMSGAGKVDAYGNLELKVVAGDRSWKLTGKLAPPALYKKMPKFKTVGQAFLLVEENGQAVLFLCQTK